VRRATVILCSSVAPSAIPRSAAIIILMNGIFVGDSERAVQVQSALSDVVQTPAASPP